MKLNLKEIPKKVLELVLSDDTEIKVAMPKTSLFEELESFRSQDEKTIGEMYGLMAKLLSCNLEGVEIKTEYLVEILDFEDISNLFQGYVKFVQEVVSHPN